jgi:succinate dehydrogenase / fumarate reductase membrane anchor subunit
MRLSSAALVPLTIAFVWLLLSLLPKDYNGVRAELGHPIPALIMMLFVLAGIYHMQLGMRSVIVDYIPGHAREWALMANLFFAAVLALACVYAVLRIGFV